MAGSAEKWSDKVQEALAVGQPITVSSDELNQACDHIVQLLKDASLLLKSGSHASSVFFAITALEETAKIHMGMYRKSSQPVIRKKDSLYKHNEKHHIAAAPTIALGGRLQKAIGEQRMLELIEWARSGRLIPIREGALYIEKRDGHLQIPRLTVSSDLSRELLLFALEAFDDAFVGYTDYSYEQQKITDQLFHSWQNA